jgi:hypothetical protein
MDEFVRTADGAESRRPVFKVDLEWHNTRRTTYIIALDGSLPLLGVELLADSSVYLEMTDGGEVTVQPL